MKNIGDKIKKYREMMKMSKRELARRIECDESLILKYENGQRNISLANIFKISEVLRVPKEFFFTNKEYKFSAFARGSVSAHKEEYELIKELNENICYNLSLLTNLLDLNLQYNGPRDKFGENVTDSLIQEIKKSLCLSDKFDFAILSKQLLEKWKVMVFELPFDIDSLSGLTLKYDEIITIFINKNNTPERKLFSLIHEICHIVLHQHKGELIPILSRNDPKEKEANVFAGSFLVPSDLFLDMMIRLNSNFTKENIQKLAECFNVSYSCIFYKLEKMGKVSYKQTEITPEKYDLKEEKFLHYTYDDFPLEYNILIYSAIKKEKISISKASEMWDCPIDEIEENIKALDFFSNVCKGRL